MNLENQEYYGENFSLNNLSTSRSINQFFNLVQFKHNLNCTRLDNNLSTNFWLNWLSNQLLYYIKYSFDYSAYLLYFVLEFILFYSNSFVEFLKSAQLTFASENYFESLTNKFEFKIFVLLILVILILLVQIAIASGLFKQSIHFYQENQSK